jgi:hypothetical protein
MFVVIEEEEFELSFWHFAYIKYIYIRCFLDAIGEGGGDICSFETKRRRKEEAREINKTTQHGLLGPDVYKRTENLKLK